MARVSKEAWDNHYKYQAKPAVKKARALNNKARRMMKEEKGAAAVAGKDVHHIKPQRSGGATAMSNLRVETKKKNRGWKRGT